MKTPALTFEAKRPRTFSIEEGVLHLSVGQNTVKIGLAGKSIRDLALSLLEFGEVARTVEPYSNFPAEKLEIQGKVLVAANNPHTFHVDLPEFKLAEGDRPQLFRVVDPDDPDEDFLQAIEIFL